MAGKHIEAVDLNVSARDKQCKTCLKAKQTNSPTTGKLVQLEEDHVEYLDRVGHINPHTDGRPNYILTLILERYKLQKFNG